MSTSRQTPPEPTLWTYDSAPSSPALAPYGITTRQLRRWVEAGRVTHVKRGNRVIFLEEHLRELVASMTVHAVR